MSTCLLFTKHLNQEGCLSLRLNDDGQIDAPAIQRSFQEIQALQAQCRTWIVLPCAQASIFEVELPWLNEKKARAAIPFALEDELSQPIESLHFSFDRQHYQNNHYQVAIIDKEHIRQVMGQLQDKAIRFDRMTLDWFALHDNELCLDEDGALINQPDMKGVLSNELLDRYLKQQQNTEAYCFTNSKITSEAITCQHIEDSSFNWIAKRLIKTAPMNLCQGDFEQKTNDQFQKKVLHLTAALAAFWLLSMLGSNLIKMYYLNKDIAKLDQQIELIYKRFFPEAKQVISPKFRIGQLLGDDKLSNASFWRLLNALSSSMKTTSSKVEQLRYQDLRISIQIASPDFASLEQLEDRLKQMKINVNRTQAATHDEQIIATLELS